MTRTRCTATLLPGTAILVSTLLTATTPRAQGTIYLAEYAYQAARVTAVTPPAPGSIPLFAMPTANWVPLDLHYRPATNTLWWVDNPGPFRMLTSDLAGNGLTTLLTSSSPLRGPVPDASGRLFYTEGNTLRRIAANGSGATVLFTANQSGPLGCPAVDRRNGHVYVGADGDILRLDLDGGNRKTIVDGIGYARAIALDIAGDRLFWIDAQPASDFLGSARLDGSNRRVVFDNSPAVAQTSGLVQFAFDAASASLVVADELTGTVRRIDPATGAATLLHTVVAPHSPSGVALATGLPAEPLLDCNRNGVADDQDLAQGTSFDCNGNGRPDECEADPCPARRWFLDHGSNPSVPGRAAGCAGTTPGSCFQSFQPFDVPAPGIAIAEVALDGWMANRGLGEGLLVDVLRDDGTGNAPDETTTLASTSLELRYDPDHVHWVYAPLAVALSPGRHWLRIGGGGPTVQAGVNVGTGAGLPARVRSGLGTWFPAPPLAVRLVAADLAASMPTVSLQAAGGVDFVLDAGPAHGNELHWLLGSWSGTQPGLPLGPGVTVPVQVDPYTMFTAQQPNGPVLIGFLGRLDAQGRGRARLQLPAGLPAAAAGLVLHHAFFTLAAGNVPTLASRAIAVRLVP